MKAKRIAIELQEMKTKAPEGTFFIKKHESDNFICAIQGPKGTPYENGFFRLDVRFPNDYPFSAPQLSFITPILHPNISGQTICLDILGETWKPTMTLGKLLVSIRSLLNEPNFSSPLNSDAASLYKKNKKEYHKQVKELVEAEALNIF